MRRRGLTVVILVFVLGGSVVLGWVAWRWYNAPHPPDIPMEGLDADLATAIDNARRKIRKEPYSAPLWGELGAILRSAQFLPEAAACYAQAEQLDPPNPRWPYLQGEALRLIDCRAALSPLQRAAALGREIEPIAPRLRLAEVLLALGRYEEAEQQLRQALAADPDDPSIHYNLGVVAVARDDLPGALTHWEHSEHSRFTQQKTCGQLAALYDRLGRNAQADRYSRKADALPPDQNWIDPFRAGKDPIGRPAQLQQVRHWERQGDYSAAVEQLTELIKERPDYALYVALGNDLVKLGDFDRAEIALRQAIALVPDGFRAHHERSQLFWLRADRDRRNNPKQARTEYAESVASARRALERRPDSGMTWVVLGLSLRGLGKRDDALDAFGRAIVCNPELTEAHLYLGEILVEAGRKAEAQASLQRAVQLARPEDRRPREALEKLQKSEDRRQGTEDSKDGP
jgi:tetratricopeptide (TPR) repeat protein